MLSYIPTCFTIVLYVYCLKGHFMILSSICLCFPFILKCIYCLDQQNRDLRSKTEKSQFRKHPLKQSVCPSGMRSINFFSARCASCPKGKEGSSPSGRNPPLLISSVLFLLLFYFCCCFFCLFSSCLSSQSLFAVGVQLHA